jgi:Fe-S-cluster containining protein
MMENKSYPCTQCGLCCKAIGKHLVIIEMLPDSFKNTSPHYQELKKFPFEIKPDGVCSKLSEDGKCTVYENRPTICDIYKMWEKYFSSSMSYEDYKKRAANQCNKMIRENNLHTSFMVKL